MRAILLIPLVLLCCWPAPSVPDADHPIPGAHCLTTSLPREPLPIPAERSTTVQMVTEGAQQLVLSGTGKPVKVSLNLGPVPARDFSGVFHGLRTGAAGIRSAHAGPSTPRAPPAPHSV